MHCACGTVNDPDAAFCKRCGTALGTVHVNAARSLVLADSRDLALALSPVPGIARSARRAQMPDPKQMSGVPLPVGDLPPAPSPSASSAAR